MLIAFDLLELRAVHKKMILVLAEITLSALLGQLEDEQVVIILKIFVYLHLADHRIAFAGDRSSWRGSRGSATGSLGSRQFERSTRYIRCQAHMWEKVEDVVEKVLGVVPSSHCLIYSNISHKRDDVRP